MLVWGELTGWLENEGRPITAMDSLIAAIALQGNSCLITRNEQDFEHIGVKIINPWEEAHLRQSGASELQASFRFPSML
jgi:tRNA(fMet)-specific endonuclease VapC